MKDNGAGVVSTEVASSSVLAWHFVGANLRDGRPVPQDGETLRHDGPLELCKSGLHASERIIDALGYATAGTVCRVRCDGEILRDADKLVCRERTILWRCDAHAALRKFARACALDVVHLWPAPPIVLEYLRTGREDLRDAALDAAQLAAQAAADTAQAAAWAAAQLAALAAAWAAAQLAALADDRAAAQLAALADDRAAALADDRAAARDAQDVRLEAMVRAVAHAEEAP